MKFAATYAIFVGVLMLVQWIFFAVTGQIPELQNEPVRIGMHLAGEGITALMLIFSGVGLFRGKVWGRAATIFALGMLTYTVIVSPGYFAQKGVWPIVVMFALLLVLTMVSLNNLLKMKEGSR